MKQEDKELLIKDLCARLPYGVKVHCTSDTIACAGPYTLNTIVLDRFCNENTEYVPFNEVKPYLFPMSSMTEEQKREYVQIANKCSNIASSQLTGMTVQDWFDKNHLDYRGLIPRGLAIDSTNLNVY